jgi:ABC-type transport system involved in cytochrome c biogenesis permease component
VEEYKVNIHRPGKLTRMRSAASGLLWTLTIIVYFLLSFGTNQWQLTWIAFPIAAVLQQVISSLLNQDRKFFHSGILYTTAAIVYLELSFYTNAWYITWLIFLFAVVISQAIRLIKASRDTE